MYQQAKNQWTLVVPIKPVPKARARAGRNGSFYTPDKTKRYETELRSIFAANNPPMFKGAVGVNLVFNLIKPVSAKFRPHPAVKSDLDNLIKAVSDAGNGVLYADDAQICQLVAMKRYADKCSVAITVFEL